MAEESAVKVCVRVRPIIQREESAPSETAKPVQVFWKSDKKLIHQIDDGSATKSFSFDRVFTAEETTIQVYQDIAKPLVVSTVEGYNGTIFAYGQTSSGKTFTMMGSDHVPGVIPLAVDDVFETIKKCPKKEFLLRVSYMEIYNETVTDLLVDSWKRKPLEVRETTNKTIHVVDLTEELVTSSAQVLAWIRKGEKNRHYGKTKMNERSSRSHTVFRMILESRERSDLASGENADGAIIVSHLNLVDLAGSERASQTGAEGARLKEGCNINRSLFTLGQVIKKLSEDSQSFINYRDSKLTRILQNSLGGNAKTVILCTITTASLDETLRTLQFASTAKKMKNDPHVTEVSDDGALLKRYRNEIVDLKRRLQEVSSETQTTATEREVLSQLLQEKHQLQVEQEDRIRNLTKLLVTSTNLTRVQKVPKRRVTWGGKMLCLAHTSPSQDGLSGRSFVEFVDQRRKADSTSAMEMLVEDDEDFDGHWDIPDESSDDTSGSQDFITFRSLGNRSVERVAELELELQTVGQQKQQALDQIAAMEEKAREVDLQLKSEAQQKAEAIEKVELLELCVTELNKQLEQSDKELQSDEQLAIDFAEIVQRCEILATEKDMLASEQDHLKQELDFAVRQTQKLEKEKTSLSRELKEKDELQEFIALEEKIRDEHESELENQICSLKEAMKSRDLQYMELKKNLETVSEELTKKTQIADDLQNMCGKDVSEEVVKLRLSLADAEVLGIETKKEWAVLRTENIALEELKMTLTVSHEKMEAEVNSLRFQLEAEKSNFKKMQADLQKELSIVFNENLKLTTLLDGKVPRNIMDSVELEKTVSNLQKELAASQEAEGDLRAQLQELKSLQAPAFEVNNPEKQISAEDTVKEELVVTALTEERDQLRVDLKENIDMMIENQEELRTAHGKIADLKQRLKQLEDSQTSNLGKPFDDMTTELETLQTQKEQLQAALQEVSEQKNQLKGELQQFIDGAAENESLLHSLQSQLQDQVQRNNDIERMGREKQTQLEHQVEESQHILHSIQDEFEDLKQKNCTLVKVTEEKESDLKQSIKILSEELETLKAERDDLCFNKEAGHQTLMEETQRLLCRVTSLIEERDQLLDTVEELRLGKIQLKTELEENVEMMTLTVSHEKMEAEVNSLRFQLEAEKSNFKKMQADLQKELSIVFNENLKLTTLLDGKVPRNIMDSVELEKTVSNLQKELAPSQEAEGDLRVQLQELKSLQAPSFEVNNPEKQISAEDTVKEDLVVTALTEERDQLRMDLKENIDMMIENQEELRTAHGKIADLKQRLKQLEDSQTSNLGKPFDDMTTELETLQTQKEQLQAALQEVSEQKNQLEGELQQLIDGAAENESLLHSLQSQLQDQVQRNNDIERMGREKQTQLEHQVEESQHILHSIQDEFEDLKQKNCTLVKVTEEKESDLKQSIKILSEELETLKAERDDLCFNKEAGHQTLMEETQRLLCRVTSLIEERDQLLDTVEELRLGKIQLKTELEENVEMRTENQAELITAQEKINVLQEEVSLLMNENKDVGKCHELQNQIQRLSEELECAVTERSNIQSEMEKLVCQVTSLREERDQLHGQLQAVGQETNQFRAQLEASTMQQSMIEQKQLSLLQQAEVTKMETNLRQEVQQLEEQLNTLKKNETVVLAEAIASQQLLVEAKATISLLNEKLSDCERDLTGSKVTASSRLHNSTLQLQELFERLQQFIDESSQPHPAFKGDALWVENFLSDEDYDAFPQTTVKAHNIVSGLGIKHLRTLRNIIDVLLGKAKGCKWAFQELVKIDVCIFEAWRSQDVLRGKADSLRDLDCCSDQEHRLDELVSKRQFYVQKMGDILEKLWSGLDYYRNEVSAEVRERTRFLRLMQDEHARPPLVVSRMHSLFSAEADSRSAVLQSRQIYLQGLVDDRTVQCEELQQVTAHAQFQLEEEQSKYVTLQRKLEETPARPELTLLINNKELILLHQAEERVKALALKNKHLEEAQQKNHSCISGYKMDIQRLQTELVASGVQVQELKNAIKTMKSQLQESEKCVPPSIAELQKAQAQLFMKEMELSVASDKHQQEIERMTTVLHMKEELVRKLKESLRTLQQQGEESFLQGQELYDRFLNPRGLVNKSSGVLQNSKLAEEVKQLQIKIVHLENVISSQQADLTKWKNRALKLKSKAKVDVKPSQPCTPTKQGLAVCSDFLPQSPKKFVVASQKVLDSSIQLLESPKVLLLDSPKSKFFDKGANADLLPGTIPKMFFDNSSLGISADANPDGCASQPPEALESCITQ